VDIQKLIEREIASEPFVELDYVETVDGSSLITVDEIVPGTRILIAAAVGKARLIDNIEAFTGITGCSS